MVLLTLLVLAALGALLPWSPFFHGKAQPDLVIGVLSTQERAFITYLANEGVLIQAWGKKVVMDGMFRHLAGYQRPSDAMRSDMQDALGLFAGVDLVLATHHHADHFDARVVGWHPAANPKATFVAVKQVTESLAKGHMGYEQIAPRVLEVTPDFGQRKDLRVADINLSVIRLRHGNTMNVAFLLTVGCGKTLHLTVGGRKILHLGDSER